MKLTRKLYAIACIPVVLIALAVSGGNASATTPAGKVTIECHGALPATAIVEVSNTGWWWGISSDMVITASDVPGIPAGTHVPIGHPVTATIVAQPATLHLTATWPAVNDEQHELILTVPASDCPTPTCPDGQRPIGVHQDGTLDCVDNPTPTTSTTVPAPTSTSSTLLLAPAPPAQVAQTTPAFTG